MKKITVKKFTMKTFTEPGMQKNEERENVKEKSK